jgi:hypothetical protein
LQPASLSIHVFFSVFSCTHEKSSSFLSHNQSPNVFPTIYFLRGYKLIFAFTNLQLIFIKLFFKSNIKYNF